MPTSWVSPNRSPLAQLSSICSVSGRLPAGPGALVRTVRASGGGGRMSDRSGAAEGMGVVYGGVGGGGGGVAGGGEGPTAVFPSGGRAASRPDAGTWPYARTASRRDARPCVL